MKKNIIYIISFLLLILSLFFIYKTLYSPKSEPAPQNQPTPTPTPKPQVTQKPSAIELHNSQQEKYIAPTPTPDPQIYACDPAGNCNSYLDPITAGCPTTFKDRYCNNRCSDPSIRCKF